MLESEKFAIAAHLHVLLRRTNGRVTDVEWMIKSPEYAHEIIRVARTEAHPDLHKLADKLEFAIQQTPAPRPVPARPAAAASKPAFAASESGDSSSFPASEFTPSGFDQTGARKRYVGTLR